MDSNTELLNPQQKSAVEHVEGPLLVIAGAGSGKTRIVTYRIAYLLTLGVPASEIIAVTFTNKAAEEMRHRVHKLTQSHVLTCTFHSLSARILRESITLLGYSRDFTIFDEDDSEKLLKECFTALGYKEEKGELKTVRSHISFAKNNLLEPEDLAKEEEMTARAYALYQEKLKQYNALDFDDLLFLTVKLFRAFPGTLESYQNRWTFVLIDEYQDTNKAQYLLIQQLVAKHQNLFAVGDPDQSIYSWRGANIHNILNFEQDFPGAKVITLEQNYRSRNAILKAANALISHNQGRCAKELWSDLGEGEKLGFYICENDRAEALFVLKRLMHHLEKHETPLNDCVIFYRTNFQSRIFEDALLRERIPYIIVGSLSFYQRKEIKDILAYLRLSLGGSDFISFARTINLPKRGIGETTLEKLRSHAESKGITILALCNEIATGVSDCKISPKQLAGIKDYVEVIHALKVMGSSSQPLHRIISELIDRTRYVDYLREDPETYAERRENVEELLSKAAEWDQDTTTPSLALFLEDLSLKSSADQKTPTGDALKLMTLHHGKGLEFSVVFLVGMEEELLPHLNSIDSEEAIEEERRLCYVGMTRAKEYLYLSAARQRFLWGTPRFMRPSRFLSEIPQEYLQAYHAPSMYRGNAEEGQEAREEEPLSIGSQVLHRDFGKGIVRKIYQTSLGLTYDVFFPESDTTRTLVAKYAKLTPLF